jgi:hypothetical protein
MLRILLAAFFLSGATLALAAPRTAPPPPSGTVVHLFGPQGVWANLAPVVGGTQTAPAVAAPVGAVPAGATPATLASTGGPAPASSAPARAGAAPAAQNYPEPTLGAVLHQMFVTGDPNAGPGFAQGRKGN